MPDRSLPQLLAVALGLGGAFWGVFVLLAFGLPALIPLPFGVGYAVTAGYLYRAIRTPLMRTRRRNWLASLVIQGGWLALVGLPLLAGDGMNPFTAWWLFATGCSLVGLMSEAPDQPAGGFATSPDLVMRLGGPRP